MSYHGFVAIQGRGVVALPAELRRRHGLDEAGVQMEITERDDGVIELRPTIPVPADQAWFWAERWQQREREVDAHIAAGDLSTDASTDDFLATLDALADEETSER
ncbi:AbrB/MazE/SpoVT family DNA-binding domain-containing protein [Leifsonia naganoensis]|uniref:Bifunctional DNA-binding transcriptional regulator/antitoxin component of YhaV-PrlF toxin-antitoxin module n=1 Tax=Leifsonia naganoensis TaxID=150025 RepID=A0A853DX19_9MICO|nr:AbrB/MazE/SpoVT family DNA-binding domain-containing protein [Leifsonia naganoensis]NYK10665.1 bifunctional DNA-binding transcriptional regulator/antitoxin component of YhaV-PrlF toxin-antitoxin module [Leifsonia naganoensis]